MTQAIPRPVSSESAADDLSEAIYAVADRISLSDLLEHPELTDEVIRFACSMRKQLLVIADEEPTAAKVEAEISKLYHLLGHERRTAAFTRGRREMQAAATAKDQASSTPSPAKPQAAPVIERPRKPVAAQLSREQALNLATEIIGTWRNEKRYCFTASEIETAIEQRHTNSNELLWDSRDLIVTSTANHQQERRWQQSVHAALSQLISQDAIAWRSSQSHYFIFSN